MDGRLVQRVSWRQLLENGHEKFRPVYTDSLYGFAVFEPPAQREGVRFTPPPPDFAACQMIKELKQVN